nr:sirohydrochlorin cobaltochelatase [Wansuia hejianensis]
MPVNSSVTTTKTFAETKKAILVVSFGTSYEETRKVTIDAIEQEIGEAYPDYVIYRAWTSKMILRKLKKRDNIHYDTVTEAFRRMHSDGITDVVVQPTHVINGIENDLMTQEALAFRDDFHSILFGNPLLTTLEDTDYMIDAIHREFPDLADNEVLVLMGHGTTHYSNSIYAALDYTFKDRGFPNIFLGTVESYPSMESLLHMVKEFQPRRVVLAPFMIVAGDHAQNDMAGDNPESWRCQLEAEGLPVTCVLKGLGEYKSVRQLFLNHVRDAIAARP